MVTEDEAAPNLLALDFPTFPGRDLKQDELRQRGLLACNASPVSLL
jgi:hypothetical protein